MNPYYTFSELLFTCVNHAVKDVSFGVLNAFNGVNKPHPKYFVNECDLDFSLAYIDCAERNTTKPHRIIFWEPRIRKGCTVIMGRFRDGLAHSISRVSESSPHCWINVRIYDDEVYPGCFFDYYADYRKTQRRLMACKDDRGWDVVQQGPVQSFENSAYYNRPHEADRLTRDIMLEYLSVLGYDIAHDNFWATDVPAFILSEERPGNIP